MLPTVGAPVSLSFPAKAEYLRLARLAAADAASRAGFDVDDIDDVRIAVSELCGALGAGGRITLTMFSEPGRLEVRGASEVALAPKLDGLTRTVVRGVVDDYELSSDPVGAFSFVKGRAAAARSNGATAAEAAQDTVEDTAGETPVEGTA
jgi:serine/threonine-protein kinase RsbW